VNHSDYESLFNQMHPGFFEREEIRRIPEDQVYEEMILELAGFRAEAVEIPVPAGVSFGFYRGDLAALHESVALVNANWVRYFNRGDKVYCAMDGERVVSFCNVEDMGRHTLAGRPMKVAGPGCVGTIPACRRRGVGLKMVQNVTALLKDAGYDLSYIHYTGVAPWYAKLGYGTILRWNSKGLIG